MRLPSGLKVEGYRYDAGGCLAVSVRVKRWFILREILRWIGQRCPQTDDRTGRRCRRGYLFGMAFLVVWCGCVASRILRGA